MLKSQLITRFREFHKPQYLTGKFPGACLADLGGVEIVDHVVMVFRSSLCFALWITFLFAVVQHDVYSFIFLGRGFVLRYGLLFF